MAEASLYDVITLFSRIAESDEHAFRNVFDHYRVAFHAAAFKMTRSADISEEIIQEVFVSLWNKRKQVGEARDPEAYLFKILHNSIYNHFRKLAREKKLKSHLAQQSGEIGESPVEELLFAKENRQILESIISQMPAQQQLVYRLSKQEGLSREEIAERLNISPNTVRNHLAKAIEFMRTYFEKGASAIIWAAIWHSL